MRRWWKLGSVLGGLLLSAPASAQQLFLLPESKLWIEGNSTLHAWKATATELTVTGHAAEDAGALRWNIVEAAVRIPVRGLKSGTEGLDENMYEDLRAEKYPTITFRLKECVPAGGAGQGGIPVHIIGWLTVAGKERLLTIPAQWSAQEKRIRITGSTTLRMTDFGIKPRTFMVVMKVHDEVRVHFDFFLGIR